MVIQQLSRGTLRCLCCYKSNKRGERRCTRYTPLALAVAVAAADAYLQTIFSLLPEGRWLSGSKLNIV